MNFYVKDFPGWQCCKCGHTGQSRGSYPCECPGCKQTVGVASYSGPHRNHPYISERTGQFGYRFSGEPTNDWSVTFHNVYDGLNENFVVDVDYKFDTQDMSVLKVAEGLAEIIGNYLYSTQQNRIPKLVSWLSERAIEHDLKEAEFQVEWRKWELWKAVHALRDAEDELDSLVALEKTHEP